MLRALGVRNMSVLQRGGMRAPSAPSMALLARSMHMKVRPRRRSVGLPARNGAPEFRKGRLMYILRNKDLFDNEKVAELREYLESMKRCSMPDLLEIIQTVGTKKYEAPMVPLVGKFANLLKLSFTDNIDNLGVKHNDVLATLHVLRTLNPETPKAEEFLADLSAILRSVSGYGEVKSINIGKALFGLRRFSADSEVVQDFLAMLVPLVEHCEDPFSIVTLSNCFYGMQSMSSDHEVVRKLLKVLTKRVKDFDDKLSYQAIGNILYGFKNMSSEHKEVRMVLKELKPHIQRFRDKLDAQAVANALYGMHKMSSEAAEVRGVLAALTPHIRKCNGLFDGQNVANALYGFQNMSTECDEVKGALNALVLHIRNHSVRDRKPLSSQALGNALYGMQRMTADHSDVRGILSILLQHLSNRKQALDAQAIGNGLYGLQSMSSEEHDVVNELLSQFSGEIQRCNNLTGQHVANALYGLQHMNSNQYEVRLVLAALAEVTENLSTTMKPQEVATSFYGLQNMTEHCAEIDAILNALLRHAKKGLKNDGTQQYFQPYVYGNILYGLRHLDTDEESVQNVLAEVAAQVGACNKPFTARASIAALQGVQRMSTDCEQVRKLFAALAVKVPTCKEPFTKAEVLDALETLAHRSSANEGGKEVPDMMLVLSKAVRNCEEVFDPESIVRAFGVMRNKTCEKEKERILLNSLCSKLDEMDNKLSREGVAKVLEAVDGCSAEHQEVKRLIVLLKRSLQNRKTMPTDVLTDILYSLRNKSSSESVELRGLLSMMMNPLRKCKDTLTHDQLADVFEGLRWMRSSNRKVRGLLSGLDEHMEREEERQRRLPRHAREHLRPAHVARVLNGMQSMSSDHEEVQKVLSRVVRYVPHAPLRPAGVVHAFAGMQEMNDKCNEVQRLLYVLMDPFVDKVRTKVEVAEDPQRDDFDDRVFEALTNLPRKPKYATITEESLIEERALNAKECSAVLWSLRNMSGESKAARRVLRIIRWMLDLDSASLKGKERDDIAMTAAQACSALGGLRSMSATHAEVGDLMDVLVIRLCAGLQSEDVVKLSVEDITNALEGLSSATYSEQLHGFFTRAMSDIQSRLDSALEPDVGSLTGSRYSKSDAQLLHLLQTLKCLRVLNTSMYSTMPGDVRESLNEVERRLAERFPMTVLGEMEYKNSKLKFCDLARQALDGDARLHADVLFEGFNADIVIDLHGSAPGLAGNAEHEAFTEEDRLQNGDAIASDPGPQPIHPTQPRYVNVEIDGAEAAYASVRRANRLRDACLAADHEVKVHRWNPESGEGFEWYAQAKAAAFAQPTGDAVSDDPGLGSADGTANPNNDNGNDDDDDDDDDDDESEDVSVEYTSSAEKSFSGGFSGPDIIMTYFKHIVQEARQEGTMQPKD